MTNTDFWPPPPLSRCLQWSPTAVLGDAAYGPSFTGQGASMALVGAYMLAGALDALHRVAG